ncbi:MAG: ATP-binding cassette domain-containing protein [Pseudomonadota bacterium]
MTALLLELRGLCGGYDPIQIFQDVDLSVPAGGAVGFFGPNGHGKTTLMKTVSGVLEPWRGDVIFEGRRMNRGADRGSRRWRNFNYDAVVPRRMDPKAVARAGLIHVAQGSLLFPEMTVEETLSIAPAAAAARAGGRAEEARRREEVEALFPRLAERRRHKARYLSGGERQMLSIAAGLMAAPKLLILDEPTLGLSPRLRGELCDAIHRVRAAGTPLILIDQDVGFLKELIEELYLFDHGRISHRLQRDEVPSHDRLMAMLFGEPA